MRNRTGERIGRYLLVERLGRGATAEAWRATLEGPGGFRRDVVLKRLVPELEHDQAFARALLREARLGAQLDHANIVQTLAVEEIGGELVVALEWIDGCDLRQLAAALEPAGPAPVGAAVYVGREVARALEHAHGFRAGAILHRDVTPANVAVARDGRVKLLDFGIAKALEAIDDERTRTGVVKGTLAYMAPEQLAGGGASPASDVYGLGVILHELLTGHRLWRGPETAAEMAALRIARPLAPSRSRPDVPPALDDLCLRALDPDPAARPSAGELQRALGELGRELHFDAAELAALVPARAPAAARPRTETAAPSRRSRALPFALVALAAAALTTTLLMIALRSPAPPPASTSAAPLEPAREPEPPSLPAPAPTASAPDPIHPISKRAKSRNPDLARGKLLDPFKR
jgi:serine/threonine-protein kinase